MLVPLVVAQLACALVRTWNLFSLSSGTLLSKYVNLISDTLWTQKKSDETESLFYPMSLPTDCPSCNASGSGRTLMEKRNYAYFQNFCNQERNFSLA
jgi:hypothetical protein